jgi:hypothetical protein
VRRRAVAAVAAVEGERTTTLLRTALDDADDDLAALALGARGGTEAVPVLVLVLVEMVAEGLDVEAAETCSRCTWRPRGPSAECHQPHGRVHRVRGQDEDEPRGDRDEDEQGRHPASVPVATCQSPRAAIRPIAPMKT